jgi:redox-sensitive bicupin YhaK (pirin superfamily)
MIEKRSFQSLGQFKNDWLHARHHFSFSDYYDPARMQWGSIRVWNDDEIGAGQGFAPHGHRDMEIITYVREGAITHTDSLGNRGRTEAGDVQVMSAGTGITHSEMNLEAVPTKLFQIWILPQSTGVAPSWGAAKFPKNERSGSFVTLASGFEGEVGALPIRQKARVLGGNLKAGTELVHTLDPGQHAYLVSAKGRAEVNAITLDERDAAAIKGESHIRIHALTDTELVLVEAP